MIRLSNLVQGLLDEQTEGVDASEATSRPRQPQPQRVRMRDFPILRAFCEELRAVSDEVLALLDAGSHRAEPEVPPSAQPQRPASHITTAVREALPSLQPPEQPERPASPSTTPAPSPVIAAEPTPQAAPRMPTGAPEARQKDVAEAWYTRACDLVAEAIVCASVERPCDLTPVWELMTTVLNTPGALDTFYRLACSCTDKAGQFSVHSVNVATYAMKIGLGLQYDREALLRVGVLGLLHDIGQARLPADLLAKQGTLTAEEWQLVREHPRHSASILRQWGEAHAWMADIVVQEHEREGGQGYPEGLRGEKIHAYAKIIGLADVYEALTHARSYRKGFTPFEAVKEILASQKDFFPMSLLKSMVAQLSVFPLQSYVLLNSKAIGQVVATHESAPLRPVVRLLFDSQRKPVQGEKLVDLRGNQLLYITDTLSAETIATYTS